MDFFQSDTAIVKKNVEIGMVQKFGIIPIYTDV